MCEYLYNEKDVTEIIPNLWLGNIKSAYDKHFLNKYNIKYILTVMYGFDNKFKYKNLTYLVIPIKDVDVCTKNIINIFDTATLFIHNALITNNGILVHCKKGHHRSGAIVAAYIMKYYKLNYEMTIKYIHNLRPCALQKKKCMTDQLYKYAQRINLI